MGNVMENGNKKEKVITRMAAYDWLKVMGTLMVVIGHYYAMFPNGSQPHPEYNIAGADRDIIMQCFRMEVSCRFGVRELFRHWLQMVDMLSYFSSQFQDTC